MFWGKEPATASAAALAVYHTSRHFSACIAAYQDHQHVWPHLLPGPRTRDVFLFSLSKQFLPGACYGGRLGGRGGGGGTRSTGPSRCCVSGYELGAHLLPISPYLSICGRFGAERAPGAVPTTSAGVDNVPLARTHPLLHSKVFSSIVAPSRPFGQDRWCRTLRPSPMLSEAAGAKGVTTINVPGTASEMVSIVSVALAVLLASSPLP